MDGSLPDTIKDVPGVWGNVLSFLGGAHACIGYRFSLYECVSLHLVLE
jgi:cytochrome P450